MHLVNPEVFQVMQHNLEASKTIGHMSYIIPWKASILIILKPDLYQFGLNSQAAQIGPRTWTSFDKLWHNIFFNLIKTVTYQPPPPTKKKKRLTCMGSLISGPSNKLHIELKNVFFDNQLKNVRPTQKLVYTFNVLNLGCGIFRWGSITSSFNFSNVRLSIQVFLIKQQVPHWIIKWL